MHLSLRRRTRDVFGVKVRPAADMDAYLRRCVQAYRGTPDWLDKDEGVASVGFAKTVCAETARLVMLGTKVTVGGSPRGDWLQERVDEVYPPLREWIETGCAWGTVIMKPNGQDVDLLTPEQFLATDTRGGQITGAVFSHKIHDGERERWYTRLEYHRFTDEGRYAVSNRCFIGSSETDDGRPVPIEATPWAGLEEDVELLGVERPLFGVLRVPGTNNVDGSSALGLPVFSAALKELEDLDVAYSRMTGEIADSGRIALIDDRLLDGPGSRVGAGTDIKLPRFARKVSGVGPEEYYQAIDPQLHTTERMVGVNALLSQIGFKCGFSNGYFVFDESSGMMTATQVEADDRRTVQMVKDVRDALEAALDGMIYALNAFADLDGEAPAGEYEVVCDFGDVTYNREEDRARWWSYVVQGKIPAWYYYVKFEGMTEEQARALTAEASTGESIPFADDE